MTRKLVRLAAAAFIAGLTLAGLAAPASADPLGDSDVDVQRVIRFLSEEW